MNLLPKHHDEFKSKEYWNNFFHERGNDAFEWYGSFKEVSQLCFRNIRKQDRILQIGCGNSTFSADLYDQGYNNIVNVDFSEPVIASMREQNMATRSDMVWEVMDMTELTYPDESFDVVLDKGALDALMSNDTVESKAQATSMFSNISRVLRDGGRYLCVTLAEHFILEHLVAHFIAAGNHRIQMEVFESSSRNASGSSPFLPFVIVITKNPRKPPPQGQVTIMFDSFGCPVTLQHAKSYTPDELLPLVKDVQLFSQKKFDLSMVRAGDRFETMDIHSSETGLVIPRFSIIVYDFAARAPRSAAVFFVPQGRESEYQFSTPGGLATIAEQAQCRRLLAVRCNRPHEFPDMTQLQAELSPVAMSLAPGDMGPPDVDKIPYVALDNASGWEVISSGTLENAGLYNIEESATEECYRRLIFLENQQFVQTEIRLIMNTGASSSSTSSKKSKGKGKGSNKKKKSQPKEDTTADSAPAMPLLQFDHSYLDDHHRALLVAYLVGDSAVMQASSVRSATSEAAPQISDMLSSIDDEISAVWYRQPTASPSTLLVGLGGGALAMSIQKHFPAMYLDIVELVPGLEDLAREFFSFVRGPKCRVLAADGLAVVQSMHRLNQQQVSKGVPAAFSYDHIIIDVDGKDLSDSEGLSAPPQEFVTDDFLNSLKGILSQNGVLSFNVVSRNNAVVGRLCSKLSNVFADSGDSSVYKIRPSTENVNITLHVTRCPRPRPSVSVAKSAKGKKGKATDASTQVETAIKKHRVRELENWLQTLNMSSDSLELEEMVGRIEHIC